MSGLRWTTAGESHGPALVGILEGLPAGLELDPERIDAELARRQGGHGRGGRMRIERDRVRVLAGLRAGRTLGSPLALLLENKDATIEDLPVPPSPRPGHADLAGCQRLGEPDPRAVLERASARETAMRTALGAAARQVLEALGGRVLGHVVAVGGLEAADPTGLGERLRTAGTGAMDAAADRRAESAFAGLDPAMEDPWRGAVDAAKASGDTLGGVAEVVAAGLPPGLGGFADPRQRLTSRLAGALASIPAVKGVEVGLGFGAAALPGSAFHDRIVPADGAIGTGDGGVAGDDGDGGPDASGGAPPGVSGAGDAPGPIGAFGAFARSSNRAGGLEGGMTTGAPLVLRVAMKPISTLRQGLETVAFGSGEPVTSTWQRSDVTSVPALSVVAENLVALELTAALLEAFGGATMDLTRANLATWADRARGL